MARKLARWIGPSAAVLALAVSAGSAAAQLPFNGCAYGSSSSFKVCASGDTWFDAGTLHIRVVNLNQSTGWNVGDYGSSTGGWHTIRAIGLANLLSYTVGVSPLGLSLYYFDGTQLQQISPTYWQIGANSLQIENTSTSTQGHKQGIVGALDPGPASAGHLMTTGGRYVEFRISGFTSLDFGSNAQFEWHSVQVAEEHCLTQPCSSTELTANSLKGTTDVVPEPVTMTLLGTGLLGVGLARRRRRDSEIAEA